MLAWLIVTIFIFSIWRFNRLSLSSPPRFLSKLYGTALYGFTIFLTFLFIVCSFIIILSSLFCSKDKTVAKYNEIIKDIEVSSEIEEIDSRNYNLTRVSRRIIDWNSSIAFRKKYCENFWIGIYIPNFYSDNDIKEISYQIILEREE